MAIYHFNVKVVSRGKGASAVAKAAYISGEKIKNHYDGKVHDYRRKNEVVHKEILLPSHAPPKFRERSALWNAVELAETRKNSQTAKHIDGLTEYRIRQMCISGQLPCFMAGKKYLIAEENLYKAVFGENYGKEGAA